MDYVWDYGTLDENDERNYIISIMASTFSNMEKSEHNLLVTLVSRSQAYILLLYCIWVI